MKTILRLSILALTALNSFASASAPSSVVASATGGGGSVSAPTNASSGGSGKGPTYEQFCAAVAAYSKTKVGGNPPTPSRKIYDAYMQYIGSTLPLKEQAMFIANSIWETGGFQFVEEIACKTGSCTYGKYFGRGYIQLTWDYNYKKASQEIYKDDRLVRNPELVAQPEGAWRTAVWYWNKNVAPALKAANAVETYKLGYSVKTINGALECPANDKAKNRLAIYNAVLDAWGIAKGNPGTLEGC